MSKVLITGGAGYIGSVLVGELLKSGDEVTVLDNLMYGKTSLLNYISHEKFNFIKGDVRNKVLLQSLLDRNDIIISLAALVGASLCDKNQEAAWDINYKANLFLANNKSKDQLLIYPNTNSGYGTTDGQSIITEKDPLNPISVYGKSKCLAEEEIQQVDNHVTMRLATVFGSSLRPRTDLLVNNMVLRALKDKVLIVYEGHFMRNYIHVKDIANSINWVMSNSECVNQTFNVGNDNINMSKLQLCQKIKEHLPVEIIQAELTQDPDKRNYIVSSQKFYDTGFKCQFDLDYGIEELIKMYELIDEPWNANY